MRFPGRHSSSASGQCSPADIGRRSPRMARAKESSYPAAEADDAAGNLRRQPKRSRASGHHRGMGAPPTRLKLSRHLDRADGGCLDRLAPELRGAEPTRLCLRQDSRSGCCALLSAISGTSGLPVFAGSSSQTSPRAPGRNYRKFVKGRHSGGDRVRAIGSPGPGRPLGYEQGKACC